MPADYNLYAHFSEQFAQSSNEVLLTTEQGTEFTFADIERESARLAAFLVSQGCRRGDRVSVLARKSPTALSLYLACLRSGLVFHPLNTAYQSSELEYFLGDAEPSVIVCDPAREPEIRVLAERVTQARLFTLDGNGDGTLVEQSRNSPGEFNNVHSDAYDAAALLYSSGTTGRPKGIVLTHQNLLHNGQALADEWGITDQDVLLHALPFFHVHGLFIALSCVLLRGARMRWLSTFDVGQVIQALPECTVMMGVPTYYVRLLAATDFTAEASRNIRLFVSGSAPLLVETFREFEERTGQRILERYGMTETNVNTSNPLRGDRKPGTVGLPLAGVEVRIVDADEVEVPTGEIGNIQVRGPNVFREYWKKPERAAEDFTADGFFRTGDNGLVDEAGYVSIVGRKKDMIISGGLNVYPIEIELAINEMPGVDEAAVIGVPHPEFGEAVVAVVVLKDNSEGQEAELIAQLKTRVANFKVPKRVFYLNEMPRNTMGKVQKSHLRECYKDLFH